MTQAKTFVQELQNYPWPRSPAIKAHGKRWIADPRTEETWQRVRLAIPTLSPGEFIKFVTRARNRAAGLPSFLDRNSAEPNAEEIKQRVKRALKPKKSLSDIADVLEAAAFSIRAREDFSTAYLEALPPNIISRKTDPTMQALRAFCLIVGTFFHDRCGKWLDEEVAPLADIALGRKKQTHSDTVAAFRKDRKVHSNAKAVSNVPS
jgi:hypothetical protein